MPNALDIPSLPSSTLDVPRAIVTPDGVRVLRGELDRLKLELKFDYPERLRQARESGDGGSSDDYLQIKEEEAVLRSRIARLQALLDEATVFDSGSAEEGVIGIGALVEVEEAHSARRATYRLIGSFVLQEPGDVSAASPVGQALLGRSVDDSVDVELPSGRRKKLRIVAVDAAGES